MTNELKPCPFCGGEVERDNPMPGYVSGHGFHCMKCNAYFQLGDDDIEATAHYNTRYKRTCKMELNQLAGMYQCSECGEYSILAAWQKEQGHLHWCANCGAEVVDGD